MAKGNASETQVSLKINGETASKTLRELDNEVKMLNKELRMLPLGSQEFIDKAKQLGDAQNRLQGVRDAAKEVREQMKEMGDVAKKANSDILGMTSAGGKIQDFAQTFNVVKSAILSNVAALNIYKVALAATGIGALIVALGALYTYFKKTDDGAVALEGITKGLGIAMKGLTQIVAALGEWIIKAFENPKQALIDLGDLVLNNLINRFTAFGVILDGILSADMEKITNGTAQLATGVKDLATKAKALGEEFKGAMVAGMEMAVMMDKLDENETINITTSAKLEEQITRLMLQSKDRTKTEAERIALLDRASQLETKKLQGDIAIAQQKLKLAELELNSIAKTDVAYDEADRKRAEAEAALIQLRTESLNLQEKITNRRNALLDAEATEAQKNADKAKKLQEDSAKAQLEYDRKITDLKVAAIKDEGERTRAEILVNYQRELEDAALKGQMSFELVDALQAKRDAALAKADEEDEKKKSQKAEKEKDTAIKTGQESIDLELERLQNSADLVFASESVKEQRLYEYKRKALDDRLKLLEANGKKETNETKKTQNDIEKLDNEHTKKRTENAKKSADNRTQLELQAYMAVAQTFGGIADLLEGDEKNRKKHSEAIKAFKILEVITSGIAEVGGIWENAEKNVINAIIPGWGTAFASVQTALSIARTTMNIDKISKTKYEKGGMITPMGGYLSQGSSHAQGGIHLIDGQTGSHLGEVERGEHLTVFSRNTYQNNKATIDALLDSSLYRGGSPVAGRKYADGGMIDLATKSGSGGESASATSMAAAEMVGEIRAMRQDLFNFPRTLQAVVVYEQEKSKRSEAESIEMMADA
jgi:X-X-X-Leu-X-X-Gly heptad repeat protein